MDGSDVVQAKHGRSFNRVVDVGQWWSHIYAVIGRLTDIRQISFLRGGGGRIDLHPVFLLQHVISPTHPIQGFPTPLSLISFPHNLHYYAINPALSISHRVNWLVSKSARALAQP